jgi:heme-degrading monooxygenase HmoA
MAVVKINAIEVPEGAGPELERRFAARLGTVENSPGFLGFELLRPVAGETRYFVYTRWESEEAYQAWATGPARQAHAHGPTHGEGGEAPRPVATGANLLEFEVVHATGPTR